MGQSRGGGYVKKPTTTPQQNTLINQLIAQASPNLQQASEGFKQFLPGGGGGEPFIRAAQQRFQQQTIPSILNAYGTDNKGSSALNQALAAAASNLNTDLGAQLALMQLNAASGLGGLGINQANLGSQPQFAFMPRQMPLWQMALLGGIGAGGNILGGYLGK